MKSLELAWSRPYTNNRDVRMSINICAQEGIEFFETIKIKNIQLNEVILTDWLYGTNWNQRGKLLAAIAIFLR